MICNRCGKTIPDQAKFCNHCGATVSNPQAAATSQVPPQQKPVKKKSNMIVTIVVALIVYFVVRGIAENAFSEANGSQGVIELNADVTIAMSSCIYGGLYQDGTLQYGMTKLTAPGYSLLPGEGDERDWLLSDDGSALIAAYKQNEIMGVSYNVSTQEELLGSYISSYGSAEMIDFRKTEVNGFPVIRYIVAYTDSGLSMYEGGFIVFPSETAKETIRLAMFVDVASGRTDADINLVLDTLQVSTDFALTYEDTQTMGLNRIVVK